MQSIDTSLNSLRMFTCSGCRKQVFICSHCDRGQRYCSKSCRRAARKESSRKASRRYQKTNRGARNHAARQRRYRQERQKVTHQGSLPDEASLPSCEQSSKTVHKCHFCGRKGSFFTRSRFLGAGRGRNDRKRNRNRGSPPLSR